MKLKKPRASPICTHTGVITGDTDTQVYSLLAVQVTASCLNIITYNSTCKLYVDTMQNDKSALSVGAPCGWCTLLCDMAALSVWKVTLFPCHAAQSHDGSE